MSSYGDNVFAKKVNATEVKATDVNSTNVRATDVVCTDLTSSGTITWQNFSPPITADGNIPTLAAVLQADNDANEELINNIGKIKMTPNSGDASIDGTITDVVGLTMTQTGESLDVNTQLVQGVGNLHFYSTNSPSLLQGSTLTQTVATNMD